MNVGLCHIVLSLPGNRTLKGKRRILASVTSRIRIRFNVSIAEVGDNDLWQRAIVGVSCVSNDGRHASGMLSQVVRFIQDAEGEYEVAEYQVEIIPAF